MKDRFLVKVIPPRGYSIYRFEFTHRRIVAIVAVVLVLCAGVAAGYLRQLAIERSRVAELQAVTASQRVRLQTIDRAAESLGREIQTLQTQNEQIRKTIGIDSAGRAGGSGSAKTPGLGGNSPADAAAARRVRTGQQSSTVQPALDRVEARIDALRRVSSRAKEDTLRLRSLALRILNARHLADMTRARVIAAIPSINPTFGASVISAFGYRTYPAAEFHQGVDLDANYGDTVRAAATGVIASAGWDGGFGIKIDVDHQNGYHTYYAHLSKLLVAAGQRVLKGEPIGQVGSTGFSTGPHLHYQVMLYGAAVNPAPFLAGVPANVLASLKTP